MEELQNTKQRGGMQGIVVTIMVIKNAASGMIQYTRLQEQSWTWLVITSQIDYGNGTGWNPIRSVIIAELAERSPIIIQNSSKPSSRKKFGCTDRTTVQGATFNMRGQLYRGHANATALFSIPVVSALGSESDDPGSSPGRGKALCPWDVRGKKMRAPLLGLAKSIY